MGVYIKNVTAKEMNDLFDEHAIWWIEPDDIIDIEEEPQTDCQDCKYAWWNGERYECMIEKCRYNRTERSE